MPKGAGKGTASIQVRKTHQKNEEFFLSFADSVIKMNGTGVTGFLGAVAESKEDMQLMLAKSPMLRDQQDEAIEIDSESSGNSDEAEAEDDEDEGDENRRP